MSTPSPLVPQGSIQDAPKGRRNLPVLVFSVIGLHAAVLVVGLMIGCKPETTKSSDPLAEYLATNTAPSFVTDSSNAVGNASLSNPYELPGQPTAAPGSLVGGAYTNPPALGATSAAPVTGFADPLVPTPTPGGGSGVVGTPVPATGGYSAPGTLPMDGGFGSPVVEPASSSLTEHKVKSGESFSTMAKKYGVSVNSIVAANPNVDSRRLKVGQVVLIPASPRSAAAPSASGESAAPAATTTTGSYVVKSGDNLTKIAAKHGMTVKALKSLNGLKSDRINVGQKLKVTVKAAPAPEAAAPAPASAAPAFGTVPGQAPVSNPAVPSNPGTGL